MNGRARIVEQLDYPDDSTNVQRVVSWLDKKLLSVFDVGYGEFNGGARRLA
jgi:hypothetical protein